VQIIQCKQDIAYGGPKEFLWQSIVFKAAHEIADIDASWCLKKAWMHTMRPNHFEKVKGKPDVTFTRVLIAWKRP
jgi:hypothetical protein